MDGEQIIQSPIRVQIIPRNCNSDFRGQSRVPASDGTCVCASDTIQFGDKCVRSVIFFVSLSVAVVLLVLQMGLWYLGYKKRQNDELWSVNLEELHFNEPVEIVSTIWVIIVFMTRNPVN